MEPRGTANDQIGDGMHWGRWAFGLTLYVYSSALHIQIVEAVHGLGYGDWRDAAAPPLTWVLYCLQGAGLGISFVEGAKAWAGVFRMFR